jgi:hypothetical protein
LARSPWYTDAERHAKTQPVPFSHRHHAGELGIDCRYCHTSVEKSSFAGRTADADVHDLPFADMDQLARCWSRCAPAIGTDKSIAWTRVNALPDFVYFNHSIHILQGNRMHHVPRSQIADMPLTYRANTLQMGWCLECHRQPEKYVRPREKVFDPWYQPPVGSARAGPAAGEGIQNSKPYELRYVPSMSDLRNADEMMEPGK